MDTPTWNFFTFTSGNFSRRGRRSSSLLYRRCSACTRKVRRLWKYINLDTYIYIKGLREVAIGTSYINVRRTYKKMYTINLKLFPPSNRKAKNKSPSGRTLSLIYIKGAINNYRPILLTNKQKRITEMSLHKDDPSYV